LTGAAARRIPERGGNYSARAGDPPHLGHHQLRLREDRGQHEHRQGTVEARIRKAECAAVALFEVDARVCILGLRRGEVDLGMVDRGQPAERRSLQQCEGQAAGAAADFDYVLAVGDPGVLDKQRRQAPAPAAHQSFIIAGIAR